ncbi:MAG: aldehyde dehydrogenase family protein, partial [Pseudomonadota bacterium]
MLAIDTVELDSGHLIDGAFASGSADLRVFSPIDGETLGHIADGGPDEVDAAVLAARRASAAWGAAGPEARRRSLKRFAALIREYADELAMVECVDNGGLYKALRARVVERSARNIEFFADLAAAQGDPIAPGGDNSDHIRRDPAGVAALITPWNAPLMLTTWKIGPALATGNAIVVKPPELAPASCAFLGRLSIEAGLPPGVFNIVHGRGESAGGALVDHPDVDRISFTGSPETGRRIASAAGRNLTAVSLELGGKSPLIVFKSADLDAAAGTIAHQYFNAGQVCLAGTRVLVEAGISDELFDLVRAKVSDLIVGDPRLPETNVGPLISPAQFDRVQGFVERALAAGAQAAWGGGIFLENAQSYVDRVNAMSGGGLTIELLPVNSVVKTSQMQDAVH